VREVLLPASTSLQKNLDIEKIDAKVEIKVTDKFLKF